MSITTPLFSPEVGNGNCPIHVPSLANDFPDEDDIGNLSRNPSLCKTETN
jgi:hypothetical protein